MDFSFLFNTHYLFSYLFIFSLFYLYKYYVFLSLIFNKSKKLDSEKNEVPFSNLLSSQTVSNNLEKGKKVGAPYTFYEKLQQGVLSDIRKSYIDCSAVSSFLSGKHTKHSLSYHMKSVLLDQLHLEHIILSDTPCYIILCLKFKDTEEGRKHVQTINENLECFLPPDKISQEEKAIIKAVGILIPSSSNNP